MLWHQLLGNYSNINAAFSLVDENFNQAISHLEVPTDIIWGKQDKIATFRTAQVLYHLLNDVTLQVIDDAEHMPISVFLDMLANSLQNKLVREKMVPQLAVKQQSLICDNQSNKEYSRRYHSIKLNHCTNIKLINITSNSIVIIDSLVAFEHLILTGNNTVLTLNNSVAKITNGLISGGQSIYLDDSRLDLAGVELKATSTGIHGAYQIEQQALEPLVYQLH